jgi:hypothetical protein
MTHFQLCVEGLFDGIADTIGEEYTRDVSEREKSLEEDVSDVVFLREHGIACGEHGNGGDSQVLKDEHEELEDNFVSELISVQLRLCSSHVALLAEHSIVDMNVPSELNWIDH